MRKRVGFFPLNIQNNVNIYYEKSIKLLLVLLVNIALYFRAIHMLSFSVRMSIVQDKIISFLKAEYFYYYIH